MPKSKCYGHDRAKHPARVRRNIRFRVGTEFPIALCLVSGKGRVCAVIGPDSEAEGHSAVREPHRPGAAPFEPQPLRLLFDAMAGRQSAPTPLCRSIRNPGLIEIKPLDIDETPGGGRRHVRSQEPAAGFPRRPRSDTRCLRSAKGKRSARGAASQ